MTMSTGHPTSQARPSEQPLTDRAVADLATGGSDVPLRASSFLRRLWGQRLTRAAAFVLLLLILIAIFAPLLSSHGPNTNDLLSTRQSPSGRHWLGTDALGRDVFTRLLYGSRVSLLAAGEAVSIAVAIGLPLGLLSGFVGRWVDVIIMRLNDTLMSFPYLVLAITIVGVLGPSLTNAMLAIGIVYAPRIMRITRGATLAVREEVFITATRSVGVPARGIVLRHVLPNILSPVIVQVTLTMGQAVLAEASLSFLGLGVTPPTASWGQIVGDGMAYLQSNPVPALASGFAITLAVLSFNVLGDGMRDAIGAQPGARR